MRWGLWLVLNKFVSDPEKLKELRRVVRMNNDSIYGLVHTGFQSEKEEYGEEKKLEGEQNGEKRGIKKRNIEIANTMINRGYSLKEIVEITQLNINTIKQLKLAR